MAGIPPFTQLKQESKDKVKFLKNKNQLWKLQNSSRINLRK